jgi:uncharacterized protein (DUF924 family)
MKYIEIIDFWYSDNVKKHWFSSTPQLDKEIREKYENLWLMGMNGELDEWQSSPEGCLALIILLDQFPLNMFRGQAKSFQSEKKSIDIALKAVNYHFDKKIDSDKLTFLFMPFMHSEKLEDQERAVFFYEKYNLTDNARFAKHHREIIKKFGRFPHRNKILGRDSTSLEIEYLNSKSAFKG